MSSSSEMMYVSSARSETTELTTTWRYDGCDASGLPCSVKRTSFGSAESEPIDLSEVSWLSWR